MVVKTLSLQKDLDQQGKSAKEWYRNLAVDNCEVVYFGNSRTCIINSRALESVAEQDQLEVWL